MEDVSRHLESGGIRFLKDRPMVFKLIGTVVLATICHGLFGQQTHQYFMPRCEVKFLTSEANGIEYKLYVSFPRSYKDSLAKEYPVLYLLDADYSFAIAKNIAEHLSERNHLQEILIVGIAYAGDEQYRINRTRDYTPTHVKKSLVYQEVHMNHSGGGEVFSQFIEHELIPYIDKNYRTDPFRVITGHSYGGLFSAWTLLKKPHLFSGFIIVSPSLWYDESFIFKIPHQLDRYSGSALKVFLAVGDREVNNNWDMPRDLLKFYELLSAVKGNPIELNMKIKGNETHNSVFPSSLSDGIRFVFSGI